MDKLNNTTKEELLQLNAKLQKKIEDELASDEIKRRNISQFLGSYKTERYYNNLREVKVLSWAEIYFEIGKQMARKDFIDFEGNVSELECKLEDLENKIKKESILISNP